MTRLRSFTISEKPTSSKREARRKTVGEVVTVWNRFLPALWGTADYRKKTSTNLTQLPYSDRPTPNSAQPVNLNFQTSIRRNYENLQIFVSSFCRRLSFDDNCYLPTTSRGR